MTKPPPEPVHRTILLFDIEDFNTRTDVEQGYLRDKLHEVAEHVLSELRSLTPDHVYREDRGESLIILLAADVPKTTLLRALMRTAPEALHDLNRLASESVRMRLRIVVASGEVAFDPNGTRASGVVGHDLNQARSLLDALILRQALQQRNSDSVLCVSSSIYEGTIRHGHSGVRPEDFHDISVTVRQEPIKGYLHGPPPPEATPPAVDFGKTAGAAPEDTPRRTAKSEEGRRIPLHRRLRTAGFAVAATGLVGGAVGLAAAQGWLGSAGAGATHQPGSKIPPVTTSSTSNPPATTSASVSPATPEATGGKLVLFDNFSRQNQWSDDGHMKGASYSGNKTYLVYSALSSGGHVYRTGMPKNVTSLYPKAPDDVTIDIHARVDGGGNNGYAVVCRASTTDLSGYYFAIWGRDVYIERKSPGSLPWTELKSWKNVRTVRIQSDDLGDNHLLARCVGTGKTVTLSFVVNGITYTASDSSPSVLRSGTIALAAGTDRTTSLDKTAEFSFLYVRRP